ncbi:LacI family DNA-binding transcriptional regulator [Oleiharenicola lentus]|uniref:LacI family DNA-binding transcriptional regulator n=1 Tax=Oleiharenicola lentus TaxID=2508720 RepID=UPI003F672ABA
MQSTPLRNITLMDVAQAAGLSRSGTSYALRGDRSIPVHTIERVRQLADELGYKPDLRIKALMTSVRRREAINRRECLALIWMHTPRPPEKLPTYLAHFADTVRAGTRRRADQLGCSIEEFWMDANEMNPVRLHRILRARGITGLLLVTASSTKPITLEWDWSQFAVAFIGHTTFSPPLHRAAHHHYLGVCSVLRRLHQEGWRLPAAVLSRSVQDRIHNMQAAAFLANHPEPATAADLLQFSSPAEFGNLEPWPQARKPDALLVGWQIQPHEAAILRAKFPSARRLVTLDWYPFGVLPGIDPGNGELAAKAVDLVVEQLHTNTLGLPAQPANLLVEGIWRDAPTSPTL